MATVINGTTGIDKVQAGVIVEEDLNPTFYGGGQVTVNGGTLANLDAIPQAIINYLRVGNIVTFSGSTTVDLTAAGIASFRLAPPIASDFANVHDCRGVIVVNGSVSFTLHGDIYAETTTNELIFRVYSSTLTAQVISFTATYIIK